MAQTKLNSNQLGNDTVIWTQDSLREGANIRIEQHLPGINPYTIGLFHFNNNLENSISNSYNTDFSSYTPDQLLNSDDAFHEDSKCFNVSNVAGGEGYIRFIYGLAEGLGTTDYTFDFWCKKTNQSSRYTWVKSDSSSKVMFLFANSSVSCMIDDSVKATTTWTLNEWHHYAIESYHGTTYFYKDGEIITSYTSPFLSVTDLGGLWKQHGDGTLFDEIRLTVDSVYKGRPFTPETKAYDYSGVSYYEVNLSTDVTDEIETKQDVISDLATIRSGAAAGATAVQPTQFATTSTAGLVKPDGTTITVDANGVISSVASGSSANIKAGDNITITEESESGDIYQVISATGGGVAPIVRVYQRDPVYTSQVVTDMELEAFDTVLVYRNGVLMKPLDDAEPTESAESSESYSEPDDYIIAASTIVFSYELGENDRVTVVGLGEVTGGDPVSYADFVGTDGSRPGVHGLVPAPTIAEANHLLCSDGTWTDAYKDGSEVTREIGAALSDKVSSTSIRNIEMVTQAEYDAMKQAGTTVSTTWYLIKQDESAS